MIIVFSANLHLKHKFVFPKACNIYHSLKRLFYIYSFGFPINLFSIKEPRKDALS